MVVESFLNPFSLKKKPWHMFIAGFTYSILAYVLANLIFSEVTGILMIFLIVLAGLPVIYTTIKNEEELDLQTDREFILLKEHTKVLLYLMAFFIGIVFGFTLIFIAVPEETMLSSFEYQLNAIQGVNNNVQGKTLDTSGFFFKILFNNVRVLFFCVLFSLVYGSGALFILTWNASVIAAAMGSIIRHEISLGASLAGWNLLTSYFGAATFSFFRYMTHGSLEIAAYFVGGLAGGIISIALVKHDLKNPRVLIDSIDLLLISLGLLIVGALVEVYITPVLF